MTFGKNEDSNELSKVEQKKLEIAGVESSWEKFIGSTAGKFAGKAIKAWGSGVLKSPPVVAMKAGGGVLGRAAQSPEAKAWGSGVLKSPLVVAIQKDIEAGSQRLVEYREIKARYDEKKYIKLKKEDPNNPFIKKYEEKLLQPIPEPITDYAGTATALGKFYDDTHQNISQAILTFNPDIIRKAEETGNSSLYGRWSTADAYSKQVSPGQAIFDQVAGNLSNKMFDIDITDEESRNWLFYEGDGLVGGIGKKVSGSLDLGVQLFADPFWIAGKGIKFARLATLNPEMVIQAERGASGLKQQSFFKEGKAGLDEYNAGQLRYDGLVDEKQVLNQKLIAEETKLAYAQSEYANPGTRESVKEILGLRDSAEREASSLGQRIADITTEQRKLIPDLSGGVDTYFDLILDGTLGRTQLIVHPNVTRYGAMSNFVADSLALAARNGDKRDLIDLHLIGTGLDPQAAPRLRARRAELMTILEDYPSELKSINAKLKLYSGEGGNAVEIYKEAKDRAWNVYQAYVKENAYLAHAVRSVDEREVSMVGMIDPKGVSKFPLVEKVRGKRAVNTSDLIFDSFELGNLGRTIFVGRPLYGFTSRARPNGMVTVSGLDLADGVAEFTAFLQKAVRTKSAGNAEFSARKVLGADEADKMLDQFIAANSRNAKEDVLRETQRALTKKLLMGSGVIIPEGKAGEEVLDLFIDDFIRLMDQEVGTLRETGFYTNSNGDSVSDVLLKPELAYSYYMADPADLARVIKENIQDISSVLANVKNKVIVEAMVGETWKVTAEFLPLLDQMWRVGVLARLGYPVRNVGAEWLKLAVIGGMFKTFGPRYTAIDQLPKATKKSIDAFFKNKHNYWQRMSISRETNKSVITAKRMYPIRMDSYPDYVTMQNHLRTGDIKSVIEDMNYDKFVVLAEKMRANPNLIDKQPEFIKNAFSIYEDIIVSEQKLVAVMDEFRSLSKIKRNTGTMDLYDYNFEEAYHGTQGDAAKSALSSGPTMRNMLGGSLETKSKDYLDGISAVIQPKEVEYFPAISDYIGNKVRNSPAFMAVLETTIAPIELLPGLRDEVIVGFSKTRALSNEIETTGRTKLYRDKIAQERKDAKEKVKHLEEKETKLLKLSDEEIATLESGTLPEKYGYQSKPYIKAVRDEKKRLAEEFSEDPDFLQKVDYATSAFGLGPGGISILKNRGLIPLRAIINALRDSKLRSDELSAIFSTGNIESASFLGQNEASYVFSTMAEYEGRAIPINGKKYVEVPWFIGGKEDYVSSGLRHFENNYYPTRVEDILLEHRVRVQAIEELRALRKELTNPDEMTVEELLKIGVGNYDVRTIQERYFDDIYELAMRYFPDEALRAEILQLGVGKTVSPEKLRLYLSRRPDLKPVVGDLLISEEKIRARSTKLIDPYDKESNIAWSRNLDGWLLKMPGKAPRATPKYRALTPEEQIRSMEAKVRIRGAKKELTIEKILNDGRRKIFYGIGQMPEDNLVRWPFGRAIYDAHLMKIGKNWRDVGFEPTQADFYAAQTAARAKAIAESRWYQYSAMRKLIGPGNIPFVAPFYQAAVIGAKNWGRVAWNDPSIIARRVWMWDQINQFADYDERNGNRSVTVHMPTGVIDALLGSPDAQNRRGAMSAALRANPDMRFNVSSFNLMFPGLRIGASGQEEAGSTTPFGKAAEAVLSAVGLGPLVIVGVKELVTRNPNMDQWYYKKTGKVLPLRAIFDKIVPSENITADPAYYDFLPPLLKRAQAANEGTESSEYARIMLYLYMGYVHKMETGEIPQQSLGEIEERVMQETAGLIALKALANLTLPAIPQFTGEVQAMLSVYREYQEKWKEKADVEFMEDFPDWWIISSTMSINEGGILSTVDANNMAKENKDLLNDVAEIGGEDSVKLMGMVTNREGQPTDFDSAARVWAIEKELYGRQETPVTAIEDTMRSHGNTEMFKKKEARNKNISEYGALIGKPDLTYRHTSYDFVVAQNLTVDNWIAKQVDDNHVWYTQEYEARKNGRIQPGAIRAGRLMIADEKWMSYQAKGNWTLQLKDFLYQRDKEAERYQAAPDGSPERSKIKARFQDFTDALAAENETWALYYDRFFDGPEGTPFLDYVPEKQEGK